MIGQITGIILEKHVPMVLVETQGLAYEVETSMMTFFQLPNMGEKVRLFTHLTVREDAHILYGFLGQEERRLFKLLIKVNGVGPKLALAILSSVKPDNFVEYVQNNASAELVRLPGIGKKTAERLIVEMRDKLSAWAGTSNDLTTSPSTTQHSVKNEAIDALMSLGYKQQEANRAILKVFSEELSVEALIRLALQGALKA